MTDLKSEIGELLKREYLENKINIELSAAIAQDLEHSLNLKVKKESEKHLALAQLGIKYPIINSIIVNYLASI